MNMSLSVPEWHRIAMEGTAPPVRILLNGCSMDPLIRRNRDFVTIAATDQELVPGDIVLFAVPDVERYVVHRVWKIQDGQVLTWGDNCGEPDGWLPKEAIWGRVVLIERGKREIRPDPVKGIHWARFWHEARKGYHLYRICRDGITRGFKKIFR